MLKALIVVFEFETNDNDHDFEEDDEEALYRFARKSNAHLIFSSLLLCSVLFSSLLLLSKSETNNFAKKHETINKDGG